MSVLKNDIIDTAESFAEKFSDKGRFDYSVKSLEDIENLLEEIRDYIFDDEDLIFNASTMFGSYIFEIIRNNFDSEYFWIKEENQPVLIIGQPDFWVLVKVWEKVRSRIINGEDDNIPFYFDGIKQAVEKGKNEKGYSALIV